MGRGRSKLGAGFTDSRIKGIRSGYTITDTNGEKTEWYFTKVGNQNYFKTSIGDMPRPTPNNMTEKEMISRVRNNGRTVDKKSITELNREFKAYEQGKAETDKILNSAYVRDKVFVKGSREVRTARRAAARASRR